MRVARCGRIARSSRPAPASLPRAGREYPRKHQISALEASTSLPRQPARPGSAVAAVGAGARNGPPGREAIASSRQEDPKGWTSDRAAGALPCGVGWESVARGFARDPAQPVRRLEAARSRVRRQLVLFETSVISLPGDASIGAVDRARTQQVNEREHRTPCHVVPRRRASRLTASAAPCRLVLVSTLAGGETVSQGPLESLFQVRILARQPEACESVSQHA